MQSSPTRVSKAISILQNEQSAATSLVAAIDVIFKGQCFAWEFDTIFSELEEEYGVVLSSEASDRLMALLAIKQNPAHLWDGSVFANLVETLNGSECLTDTYEQCSPGECCWALKELKMFSDRYNLRFDEEMYGDDPRIFVACCVASDGWMVLPEDLAMCREEFYRTHRLDRHLSLEQEKSVLDMAAKKDFDFEDEDDAIQVQVAKIRECKAYVDHKTYALEEQLSGLA